MNKIIVLVVIVACVYLYAKNCYGPSEVVVDYTDSLKEDADKAYTAVSTANLAQVRAAVQSFRGTEGRYPKDLQELVSKDYLSFVPQGVNYDPRTGQVSAR